MLLNILAKISYLLRSALRNSKEKVFGDGGRGVVGRGSVGRKLVG